MNISFFIANKVALNQKKSFSTFIIKIAIIAIALSTSVMIIGTAITKGYQKVISEKFYDCWGHIQITNFLRDKDHITNDEKITTDSALIKNLASIKEIKSIHTYSMQSCLMKSNQDMKGVKLKGLDNDKSILMSSKYLLEGRKLDFNSKKKNIEIIVSKSIADKQQLKVNDKVILYFLNKNESLPRARKVTVAGIYSTGLEDYDKNFILCDKKIINDINNDSSNVIQGYEIYLHDKSKSAEVEKNIFANYIDAPLQTYAIEKRFPDIFSWLGMMNMNERIIIIIMLIIAIINMITALLILIMERVQMIGILKSLGLPNAKIRYIFLYTSFYIVSIGVAIGGILGIGLSLLQMKYNLVRLDETTYYVKSVPVYLDPLAITFILVGTIKICILLLFFIPMILIRNISPTKALKFN